MSEYKDMTPCFLCKTEFQTGPHIWEGRKIQAWDVMICDRCRSKNEEGILPDRFPHLIQHLKDKGIPVRLNVSGWINIPN